jgi:hypothetical protein
MVETYRRHRPRFQIRARDGRDIPGASTTATDAEVSQAHRSIVCILEPCSLAVKPPGTAIEQWRARTRGRPGSTGKGPCYLVGGLHRPDGCHRPISALQRSQALEMHP